MRRFVPCRRLPRWRSSTRCSSRARRRGPSCSGNSVKRRTACSSQRPVSGRVSTSWGKRSAVSSSTSCRSPRLAIRSRPPGSRPSGRRAASRSAEYQVPLAILALQQGLGRLIRHRKDRGVLAVLDPRMRTKGYGRRFIASVPPAPVVHDLEAVERFFSIV